MAKGPRWPQVPISRSTPSKYYRRHHRFFGSSGFNLRAPFGVDGQRQRQETAKRRAEKREQRRFAQNRLGDNWGGYDSNATCERRWWWRPRKPKRAMSRDFRPSVCPLISVRPYFPCDFRPSVCPYVRRPFVRTPLSRSELPGLESDTHIATEFSPHFPTFYPLNKEVLF